MSPNRSEALKTTRLLMVLSSMSPLFILWAIRGNKVLPGSWFIALCAGLVAIPNAVLWFRIKLAIKRNDRRTLVYGKSEDHRDHILVYLVAILLPFYSANLGTARELSAALLAVAFIVFLFWNMNMHYMNIAFAALGYRIFTVSPPTGENAISGRNNFVVITKRAMLVPDASIHAFRISDTVFLET